MSTYLQKEIAIIEKLKATGYAAFGGSRDEALDFLEKQLASLAGRDAAADSIDALNRLSADLGLEPFADVDTSDRQAVAGVAGDFIGELYRTGTKGTENHPSGSKTT